MPSYLTLQNCLQEYMYTVDSTRNDVLTDYVDSSAASGQKNVSVSSGASFTEGEAVILYDGASTYENCIIDSIATNTLTMVDNLTNTFAEGSRVIRADTRVIPYAGNTTHGWTGIAKLVNRNGPDLGTGVDGAFTSSGDATWSAEKNYSSINIQAGHTITVSGNFAIKCQGTCTISGTLSAKGQGYSGSSNGSYWGNSGYGPGGGGVYQDRNDGATLNPWGGCGVASGTDAAGGGGGGYATAGTDGGYQSNSGYRGRGGAAYNITSLQSTFTTTYLKGAGGGPGGCAQNSGMHGAGGNGGGIIRLHCKNLVVTGAIDCDGNAGVDGGVPSSYYTCGGGGGAGGTIYILCAQKATLGSSLVHANGGAGGNGHNSGGSHYASGGAGGSGRIRIEAGKFSGTTTPTYNSITYSTYDAGGTGFFTYSWYTTPRQTLTRTVKTISCAIKYLTATVSAITVEGAVCASSGANEVFETATEQSSTVDGSYTTKIFSVSAETAGAYVTGRIRFTGTSYGAIEVNRINWSFS